MAGRHPGSEDRSSARCVSTLDPISVDLPILPKNRKEKKTRKRRNTINGVFVVVVCVRGTSQ